MGYSEKCSNFYFFREYFLRKLQILVKITLRGGVVKTIKSRLLSNFQRKIKKTNGLIIAGIYSAVCLTLLFNENSKILKEKKLIGIMTKKPVEGRFALT